MIACAAVGLGAHTHEAEAPVTLCDATGQISISESERCSPFSPSLLAFMLIGDASLNCRSSVAV